MIGVSRRFIGVKSELSRSYVGVISSSRFKLLTYFLFFCLFSFDFYMLFNNSFAGFKKKFYLCSLIYLRVHTHVHANKGVLAHLARAQHWQC